MSTRSARRRVSARRRSRPIPIATTRCMRIARCSSSAVGRPGLRQRWRSGRTGARVILAEQNADFGGELRALWDGDSDSSGATSIDGIAASAWIAQTLAELRTLPEVQILSRSTVFGYHDANFLTIAERLTDHLPLAQRAGKPRERVWRVRAQQVVLATGAIERPLVFGNNDRPGVMLASAVSHYLNRHGRAARHACGRVCKTTTVRTRPRSICIRPALRWQWWSTCEAHRPVAWPMRCDSWASTSSSIAVVVDTVGSKRISGVRVMALDAAGTGVTGPVRSIACDLLAVSGGWSPAVHLHAQSGGRPKFDDTKACFVPGCAGAGRTVGRGLQWQLRAGRLRGGRLCSRRRGGSVSWLWRQFQICRAVRAAGLRNHGDRAALACAVRTARWPRSEAVRRSAKRRGRGRHRARRTRRLPVDRTCEALHRARLRHRPGQARQHQRHGDPGRDARPEHRRDRHHDVSAQLHAGHVRRDRGAGPRRPVRADPQDCAAPMA